MMNFDFTTILSAFFAAVLGLALAKIKQLKKTIDRQNSDPPPACLKCEFFQAVKTEFIHERKDLSQKIHTESGS